MSFQQAIDLLARDEWFNATVSAMNTLLIQKGIYTQEEFEAYFCRWAEAKLGKARSMSAARRVKRTASTPPSVRAS